MTAPLNLQDALAALTPALGELHRDDVTMTPSTREGELRVEVRSTDVDALRGFDVVAMPLPTEHKTPDELARNITEVIHRELMYGQLAAKDEDGEFKRIVV
ncbi:hypothetical protein [Deinococcus koreensis]|uniref:Uncharacterized protein n=1 Tax=Deinococcus koreensis TaxID=2054903 RepID=A0A2K3UZU1_9DEIO|nr:hypothetical protein [Deinococcus koreensis]PNY82050.1 hypothetical protein CVO96_12345 [Deinococcus koreensis]